MADWAGAVAALRAEFEANFTAVPIAFQNEEPPSQPWPPSGVWAYFEVIQTQSVMRGVGMPGNKPWLTDGYAYAQIFAPKGYGLPQQLALADQAGEIFRAKTFYNTEPGVRLTCVGPNGEGPEIRGGGTASEDGASFVITVAIPFQFLYFK